MTIRVESIHRIVSKTIRVFGLKQSARLKERMKPVIHPRKYTILPGTSVRSMTTGAWALTSWGKKPARWQFPSEAISKRTIFDTHCILSIPHFIYIKLVSTSSRRHTESWKWRRQPKGDTWICRGYHGCSQPPWQGCPLPLLLLQRRWADLCSTPLYISSYSPSYLWLKSRTSDSQEEDAW